MAPLPCGGPPPLRGALPDHARWPYGVPSLPDMYRISGRWVLRNVWKALCKMREVVLANARAEWSQGGPDRQADRRADCASGFSVGAAPRWAPDRGRFTE